MSSSVASTFVRISVVLLLSINSVARGEEQQRPLRKVFHKYIQLRAQLSTSTTGETKRLLTITNSAIARELVKLAKSELLIRKANETKRTDLQASFAIAIADRILDWLPLRMEITDQSFDQSPYRDLRARLAVFTSHQRAQMVRKELEKELRKDSPQVTVVFQRRLEFLKVLLSFIANQMDLVEQQGKPAHRVAANRMSLAALEQRLKQQEDGLGRLIEEGRLGELETLDSRSKTIQHDANEFARSLNDWIGEIGEAQTRDDAQKLLKSTEKLLQSNPPIAVQGLDPQQAELKMLLINRCAVLTQGVVNLARDRMIGIKDEHTWADLLRLMQDLLEARLEFCTTTLERVARREEHLSQLKALEDHLKVEYKSGITSWTTLTQAHVVRLDAEIDLVRERLNK